MSKWKISKSMNFSYGHRVHTQNLIEEYSCDTSCKCKYLHGHNADVTVYFEADTLERGFVTDFKHANWINKFLDTYVDHKFILDINDPWFEKIINGSLSHSSDSLVIPRSRFDNFRSIPLIPVKIPGTDVTVAHILDVNAPCGLSLGADIFLDGPEKEVYEGFILVDFVPTSEYLSKWIYDFVNIKMAKIGVQAVQVDFSETPKTKATYVG